MLRIKKIIGCIAVAVIILPSLSLSGQDISAAIKLTRSERFQDAGKAFKALIQKNPQDGDLYYYYGENYLDEYFSDTLTNSFQELSDTARLLFQKGMQMDPSNPLNYVGVGEINLIAKKQAEAQQSFSRALSLLPSKANKAIVMEPQKHALVLARMANAYIKANSNDTATVFGLLRNAEKLDNKNYDMYIVKGDAYIYMLNDGSRAISSYNMAQSLNPKSPFAKLRVGQLWMRARNYKDALSYYQEVVKIDSNFAPAYRELGFLLSRANRKEEAQQNYKKFLSLSGGNITARIQYVNILIDQKDYQEAVNQLQEVLQSDTSNNDLNRAMAYSYFELGQYDKGLTYIHKFFKYTKPEKIRAMDYVYYGRLLAKNKMDSLAVIQLTKAFSMDTSKGELLSEAALSMSRLKKFDKAVEIYNQKIQLHNAIPGDYYNLGKVYYNLQAWGKVDTILGKYNEMMPNHIQGYLWRARALVNADPDTKEGLAKPVFEKLIEKALPDSAKYTKELIESYEYLSYYYLKQFNTTHDQQTGTKGIEFCHKILAMNPENEKAKAILKELSTRVRP
ncbi:MAG: tetratricopeptide repeat protein [Bacteroidota bacterium]|nr:tetratricopeptide repeat protein [Bacteroidota bacterium]